MAALASSLVEDALQFELAWGGLFGRNVSVSASMIHSPHVIDRDGCPTKPTCILRIPRASASVSTTPCTLT